MRNFMAAIVLAAVYFCAMSIYSTAEAIGELTQNRENGKHVAISE